MSVDKKNIILRETSQSQEYTSGSSRGAHLLYPNRDKESHANHIRSLLEKCFLEEKKHKNAASIKYKNGMYLEFSGHPDYALKIQSLENRNQGILLLNVHDEADSNTIRATVYIPEGKEGYFIKKVSEYQNDQTPKGDPKNKDLISGVEDIKRAMISAFWFGNKIDIPQNTRQWCEVWFRVPVNKRKVNSYDEHNKVEKVVYEICSSREISIKSEKIRFPERLVKTLYVSEDDLLYLIESCDYVAEIRRSQSLNSFFVHLNPIEQKEWSKELLERVSFEMDGTSICILDTGVNRNHQLLEKASFDEHIQTYNSNWKSSDHQGHGTEMAGVALYYDLKECLESTESFVINHEIESVKILPPAIENNVELYGDITKQAINFAEIANPKANRAICMAVTSSEYNTDDGSPTSWSGAVDAIASGADEEDIKRLVIVSAGNITPHDYGDLTYPEINRVYSVQSPGQAWNAITVGAYTGNITVMNESADGFFPVGDIGELSPYSTTSQKWNKRWPIKPDVLFDGGNMVTNGKDYDNSEELSLLTTSHRSSIKQFSTINATSSATAQASWFAAKLMSEYPGLWPETIRALIIHSAEWTEKMKKQFCQDDKKTTGRKQLLRMCGYGIPNLDKAIRCFDNAVNMIIEDELQPFSKNKMNEMHLHKVPWPKEMLLSLGNVPVTMRVTLSYFIEPGPGEIGWKDKYRYPS